MQPTASASPNTESGSNTPMPPPGRVQYSPSDLLAVLSELANHLEAAKPVMLSKDIRVNREVALGLIHELRGALPIAVEQADEAFTRAQNQLKSAAQRAESLAAASQAEADTLLANAHAEAQALTNQARVEAETLVKNAQAEADAVISGARQRQKDLIDQDAVVAQAKVRAQDIMNAAQAEAEQLMVEADAYCDNSLAKFENDLAALQSQVAAGRARLVQRHPQLAQIAEASAPTPPQPSAAPQPVPQRVNPGPAGNVAPARRRGAKGAPGSGQAAASARRP